MSTASPLIGRIVAFSTRHPLIVVLLAFLLAVGAGSYAARHFAMTANTEELISPKLEWRQRDLEFQAAFPQLQNLTIVVVDGKTPELAHSAAARLASSLRDQPQFFVRIEQPAGGPFFDRNGLLLLPLDDVRATTEKVMRAQPLLAQLAADPSLRGILATLLNTLQGVEHGMMKRADIEPEVSALTDVVERAATAQPAFFSWRKLLAGGTVTAADTRQIVLVQPVMNYNALQPGGAASDAIRATAKSLGLDEAHGVTVRLTGPVPLADEEFGSLAGDASTLMGGMMLAVLVILWMSVHSARTVVAMLVTTFIGLIVTAAAGLLVIGRFNLISVAFIPLFVGLGVDLSIQFSVRARAERLIQPSLASALIAAGTGIGSALALSAATISVGFFSFLPTSYVGVAELGAIAGLGMIVAFLLAIVLLPALLMVLRPSARGMAEVGFTMLAPIDAFIHRRRRAVLVLTLVATLAACALLPLLRFDANPLNLKSRTVESMTTLEALASDPDWTPNVVNVLVPSLDEAQRLAPRLAALPEVARVVLLTTFIPPEQPAKLALIREAGERLGPVLAAPPRAAPSDLETQKSLAETAAALRQAAEKSGDASLRRLADALQRLGTASPEARAAAEAALVGPLKVLLGQFREMLNAQAITLETLPRQMVGDWIAKDGRARIQALPRIDQGNDDSMRKFGQAVQSVAPQAIGAPIGTLASADSVVRAFLQAGVYSLVSITIILVLVLRRARDVLLTLMPVLLSGLLTFATCAAFDLPLNFANIIALPLLFGVGVAFNIYFVLAWRAGETAMLQSSLMRAVVFSAMTTATAFGALWLSSHPGTASMGRLLMISLGWELLVTLLVRPALLARPHSSTSLL